MTASGAKKGHGQLKMLNENNKHTWCVNPYINLNIEPDGRVTPCCKNYNLSYKTESGNTTINQESVINFWNSKDRINLIRDLESGKRVKSCQQCWGDEDAGKESLRLTNNKIWSSSVKGENQLPKLAYIALGNTCNLKCRICWVDRSSQFANEELDISSFKRIKFLVAKKFKTGEGSFSSENDYFWKDVLELFPEITRVHFSGGEPLYVKNNQTFIKNLVDLGYAKNINISYNTNGTLYPEKSINLLKEFRHVSINFSIDALHENFRYIRHPGNFKDWENNVTRFITENPTWPYNAVITISIFNIWDFAETYEYCSNKNLSIIVIFVYDDRSAKFIPKKLKSTIIDRLLKHKSKNPNWVADRDNVINFLRNNKFNYLKWKLFWKEVKQRDEYRNESFEKTFPDYYKEIKKYL